HNLNGDVRPDHFALCQLSEGALPALTAAWGNDAVQRCRDKHYYAPTLFHPADWREWGFRNWRVRRSLAAMTVTLAEIAVP
ncbi:MAG: hypothetical protein AAF214_06680, partial [Pseudomonadota bacterium]